MANKYFTPFANAAKKWQEDREKMYRPTITAPVKTNSNSGNIVSAVTTAAPARPAVTVSGTTKTAATARTPKKSNIYNAYRQAAARQEAELRRRIAQKESLLKQQNELMKKQRLQTMNTALEENRQQAEADLRRAYVANMLFKRGLPQQLKAQGISGGASESAIIDGHNTYINNRNKITAARNAADSKVRQAYRKRIDEDYADYLNRLYRLME